MQGLPKKFIFLKPLFIRYLYEKKNERRGDNKGKAPER